LKFFFKKKEKKFAKKIVGKKKFLKNIFFEKKFAQKIFQKNFVKIFFTNIG